jgi:hypothetical protein
MNRIELIQKLINKNSFETYVEIGVQTGKSFFPIKCKKKIAVDPFFQFSSFDKLKWSIRNLYNLKNNYFEITSEEFFLEKIDCLKNASVDIFLIDGLHTFKASLSDVLSSFQYLSSNGYVIMHDCLPPNKAASTPFELFPNKEEISKIDGWTGEWCGDVWKTIAYLKELYFDILECFILDTDYGLGIIYFKKMIQIENYINKDVFERINLLSYENLTQDRDIVDILTIDQMYSSKKII